MEIVVQHVSVEWTKESRGGAGANRRNAVPLAYALPGAVLSGGVHHVAHREWDGFTPAHEALVWQARDVPRPARFHPRAHGALRAAAAWSDHEVRAHPGDDGVIVELRPERYGVPNRDFGPAPVAVPAGTTLAWHINRRWASMGDGSWRYRLDTYRVALAPATPETFLTPATRVVDERSRLF